LRLILRSGAQQREFHHNALRDGLRFFEAVAIELSTSGLLRRAATVAIGAHCGYFAAAASRRSIYQ
jgi:hypothetical protein